MFILRMHFSFWLYTCFRKSAVFLAGPRVTGLARHLIACSFLVASREGAVLIGHQPYPVGCTVS